LVESHFTLTGGSDESIRNRRHHAVTFSGFNSKILSEIPPVLSEFENKRWILRYRGTRDGFRASNFHSKCNGKKNTITIIETTKGYVFGGYTPVKWDSSGSAKTDGTRESFLFNFRNPRNIASRKFTLSNSSIAIACHDKYGPVFGRGYDIYIADVSNINATSGSIIGSGYVNDTGVPGQEVFAGEQHFTVKEIEVFTIKT
jgi:hypothetical protein